MVNEEIVSNTIQKMRDAGLSENVIASTLSDLGLTPAQVQGYLTGKAKPSPPPNAYAPNLPKPPLSSDDDEMGSMSDLDHEMMATRTSEKVVQRLDERETLANEEASLKDNITHIALEQHGQQLHDTHQAVIELHDKIDSASLDTLSNRVSGLNARVDSLSKDVSDTKALAGALQTLLQKILETNQQLLFEMKNKK
ncbi:MAG: hypothetical protein AABX02_01110 [archaeon]